MLYKQSTLSRHVILPAVLTAFGALTAHGQTTAPQTPAAGGSTQPATKPAEEEALVHVLMKTSKGEIVLELNREKAPVTVANFLSYVDKDFYNGTVFHRIVSTFMIQGGGYTEDMQTKQTDPPIKLESENGLSNKVGTIAMARTGVPDSATSQFFINVADNDGTLDARGPGTGYAVFGRVVAGMNVVEAIRNIPTVPNPQMRGENSKPTELVAIEKVSRLKKEDAQKRIDAEKKSATGGEKPAATQPAVKPQ